MRLHYQLLVVLCCGGALWAQDYGTSAVSPIVNGQSRAEPRSLPPCASPSASRWGPQNQTSSILCGQGVGTNQKIDPRITPIDNTVQGVVDAGLVSFSDSDKNALSSARGTGANRTLAPTASTWGTAGARSFYSGFRNFDFSGTTESQAGGGPAGNKIPSAQIRKLPDYSQTNALAPSLVQDSSTAIPPVSSAWQAGASQSNFADKMQNSRLQTNPGLEAGNQQPGASIFGGSVLSPTASHRIQSLQLPNYAAQNMDSPSTTGFNGSASPRSFGSSAIRSPFGAIDSSHRKSAASSRGPRSRPAAQSLFETIGGSDPGSSSFDRITATHSTPGRSRTGQTTGSVRHQSYGSASELSADNLLSHMGGAGPRGKKAFQADCQTQPRYLGNLSVPATTTPCNKKRKGIVLDHPAYMTFGSANR